MNIKAMMSALTLEEKITLLTGATKMSTTNGNAPIQLRSQFR